MKIPFSIIQVTLFLILFPSLSYAQETGLKEKFIRTVLKPYEGGLDSYLESEKKDETERRESFFNLFVNENLEIFNDIPNRSDRGNTLSVKQYSQVSKSFGQGKKIVVELDYSDVLLCTGNDTTLFVKKLFVIDTSRIETFLKFKIRYYPKANEDRFKILSIEKATPPNDKDRDKVPDDCDLCPTELGSTDFRGCPDKDGDGIIDVNDKCPDIAGAFACQGCPDKDKDGVTDLEDECPETPGLAQYSGCPYKIEKDSDKDGIPDSKDTCPDVYGTLTNGCPDKSKDVDNDGIPDVEDNCPTVFGTRSNLGCPEKTKPVNNLDSDNDGVKDDFDECPNVYARTSNGCPQSQEIVPIRDKSFQVGIGISGGFVASSLKNVDSDIENKGGLGFSPYIFTTILLSEKSRLQLDLCYSKRSFVFSNQGDDSEYGFSDVYFYNTTDAQMSFHDFRAYGKANINSFSFGGYFGKTIKATRSGNIEYSSSFDNVFDDNYKYDFFDKSEYPVVNGEKPINNFVYGLTIGYENIFRNGVLFGIGFDYSLSNYFNENYSAGWLDTGDNIDLYPSREIDLKLHYLYISLGYRFGNTD